MLKLRRTWSSAGHIIPQWRRSDWALACARPLAHLDVAGSLALAAYMAPSGNVVALYRALGKNVDADSDSLLMPFLGRSVCRRVFLVLTGIGSSSLQKARSDAFGD